MDSISNCELGGSIDLKLGELDDLLVIWSSEGDSVGGVNCDVSLFDKVGEAVLDTVSGVVGLENTVRMNC